MVSSLVQMTISPNPLAWMSCWCASTLSIIEPLLKPRRPHPSNWAIIFLMLRGIPWKETMRPANSPQKRQTCFCCSVRIWMRHWNAPWPCARCGTRIPTSTPVPWMSTSQNFVNISRMSLKWNWSTSTAWGSN